MPHQWFPRSRRRTPTMDTTFAKLAYNSLTTLMKSEKAVLTYKCNFPFFIQMGAHCEMEEYFPAPLGHIGAGPRAGSGSPPRRSRRYVAGSDVRVLPSVRRSSGSEVCSLRRPNGRVTGRGRSAIRRRTDASNELRGGVALTFPFVLSRRSRCRLVFHNGRVKHKE